MARFVAIRGLNYEPTMITSNYANFDEANDRGIEVVQQEGWEDDSAASLSCA